MVLNSLSSGQARPAGSACPASTCPAIPGAPDEAAKQGMLAVRYRQAVREGPDHGHRPVQRQGYNRELRDLIIAGRAEPRIVVSHELPLEEAPDGYEQFDKRVDG